MKAHSCCGGKGHGHGSGSNYGLYVIGAIVLLIIVLAIANSVVGSAPVNNEMDGMMAQCSGMMNGNIEEMHDGGSAPAGMSQEEHESHHR
ncbi:hypothetical protein HY484_04715 [Candidatus Woesearchaeota archaeon]|nr:hypothetical protein [Candidatus Woesearchaeota archaeon]